MSNPELKAKSFRYSTVFSSEKEELKVVLVAQSIQQLAVAWTRLTKIQFDPSKVRYVRIEPE